MSEKEKNDILDMYDNQSFEGEELKANGDYCDFCMLGACEGCFEGSCLDSGWCC